ncbi:MAG: nucleotidyltransferase [Candidatus Methylomirabilales bacterium]
MSEELDVLKTVARRLSEAGIPYMVTGSIATNFYAVPRMTRDIDIVVELSERDVDQVVRIFQEGFYIERERVQEAIREKGMFNIIHTVHVIKVDFVVRKESDYRREEFLRRRRVSVEGHDLFIVAPEDLIISKLDWAKDTHSEVQLADARNLLASITELDRAYLAHWTTRLGLESLYREVSG